MAILRATSAASGDVSRENVGYSSDFKPSRPSQGFCLQTLDNFSFSDDWLINTTKLSRKLTTSVCLEKELPTVPPCLNNTVNGKARMSFCNGKLPFFSEILRFFEKL